MPSWHAVDIVKPVEGLLAFKPKVFEQDRLAGRYYLLRDVVQSGDAVGLCPDCIMQARNHVFDWPDLIPQPEELGPSAVSHVGSRWLISITFETRRGSSNREKPYVCHWDAINGRDLQYSAKSFQTKFSNPIGNGSCPSVYSRDEILGPASLLFDLGDVEVLPFELKNTYYPLDAVKNNCIDISHDLTVPSKPNGVFNRPSPMATPSKRT
ncbi:MAG: hypothetical protein JO270_03090 [Acidobacteriaceae bacterium]|nr:hypothetical protein [Acidobacteriaceae bacterium]